MKTKLKPGEKFKLKSIKTLIKQGLIVPFENKSFACQICRSKCSFMSANGGTAIGSNMLDNWKKTHKATPAETFIKEDKLSAVAINAENPAEYATYLTEWILKRVK